MPITTRARNLGWRRIGPLVLVGTTVAACSSAAGPSSSSGSRRATNSATQAPTPQSTGFSTRGGGVLVAVDARTGRQQWRTGLPMASVSEPVVSGGLVVVAGTDDCAGSRLTVAAVRADTGQPAWQSAVAAQNICGFDVGVHVTDGIVVAGGLLGGSADLPGSCAASGGAAVGPRAVGLDLSTGKQRWLAPPAAGEVLASTSDTVIARGANPGCLVGLDAATGQLRWTVAPPVSPLDAATAADSVFVLGQVSGGDAVSALDPDTGRKQWQVALDRSDGIGPLAVGEVLVTATEKTSQSFPTVIPGSPKPTPPEPTTVTTILCLDPATGHQLWSADEPDMQISTALGPGLVLLTHLSQNQSTVEARDSRTGLRRWQSASLPSGVGARTDGTVVVALTYRSAAAAFTAAQGRPLWTVPGGYTGAAVTADTVYLTAQSTPKNQPQGD
jgi:outer membrane protein assembly factor BamB